MRYVSWFGSRFASFFMIVILALLMSSLFVVADDETDGAGDSPASLAASESVASPTSSLPRCEGGNIDNLQNTALRRCLRFKDIFEEKGRENGVFDLGLDLLFLFITAAHENSCRSYAAGDEGAVTGGIMQVDNPCKFHPEQCPTTEVEIDYGTSAIGRFFDRVVGSSGLTGRQALWMAWFAYNRGPGAARMAIQKMREEGKTIQQATDEACAHFYADRDYTCDSYTREHYGCPEGVNPMCENGKSCAYNFYCRIRYEDVGVHYSDIRWHSYVRACEEIGGRIVEEGAPITTGEGAGGEELSSGAVGVGAERAGFRPTHPYFDVPYSVNPSFSTDIEYDFSVYDTVPEQLRRLERCKDDVACVKNNASIIEQENPGFDWLIKYGGNVISEDAGGNLEYPAWEAFCESPDVHAVNSLAEALDVVTRSQDRDCVHHYTPPIVTEEDINRWYGRGLSAGLALLNPLLGIASFIATELSDSADWDERVLSLSREGSGVRVSLAGGGLQAVVPSAKFRQVHQGVRGDSASHFRYTRDGPESIDIYKDDDGNITLYPAGDAPSSEECGLHNKILKLCVVQNTSFLAYDADENQMGMQRMVLKFAYLFSSEITDVRDFEVKDAALASNKSLLVWSPVEGVDVNFYTVYYSENAGLESNLRGQDPSELPEGLEDDLESVELYVDSKQDVMVSLSSLDDPSCEVFGTTCVPGYRLETMIGEMMSDALLEDNVLFYSVPDEMFFYFLSPVKNDHDYFFGITATDTNGDESPSFNIPASAMHENSVDDLPPALAQIREVQVGGDDVVFHIDPVEQNIDGGPLDPAKIEGYKIYCFEDGASGEFDLSAKEPLFAQGISSETDGAVRFSRPVRDFTDFACGFTGSPKFARFVVAGVKRIRGSDVDFEGIVAESSLSSQSVLIPEEV